ncbi:uncharacterized protein LOC111693051, partial [Anoplophora glabripennis]|uniref:uncharacterized protein LOC111693051 n=1 Tax=Anoplophora glabripennis TaxID=217634 RepID=UPI000C782F91
NISATSNPITCRPFFNSLGTHGGFLKECFNARENYKSADNESVIKSEEIKIKLEDDQDGQEKYESVEMPVYIKFEEIEIKREDDRDGVPSSYDLDAETIESKKRRISEDGGVIKEEYKRNVYVTHKDPSEIEMYKCNTCTYEAKDKNTRRLKKCKCTSVICVVMKLKGSVI